MSATGPGSAIEVVAVTKRFGRTLALDRVSFAVERGSVFGVIGPNGAGKTTLMRALADIVRPDSGHAKVLGVDSRNADPALRRRIGYLPGELTLQGRISGRRLLSHYADISGPVPVGHIEGLAERFHLDLDHSVRTLSKGNKQKLGIVQAFMHQPELLLLDEPTSGLDPLMQQEFLELVSEVRERGQTVFLSSHVISEIQQAADEVAILRDGHISTIATVEELRTSAIRHLRMVVGGISPPELAARLAGRDGVGNFECTVRPAGDTEVVATLSGPIGPFIRSIAALDIVDLVIEEPDLEESVLGLYAAPAAHVPVAPAQEAHA